MSRADELRAQLAVVELEERLVAAKADGTADAELKAEVRATRALARAGRDYAKVNAVLADEASTDEAKALASAELALLDKVTAAAAKHLGVSSADLTKAREAAPAAPAPGDAVASPSPAKASGPKARG